MAVRNYRGFLFVSIFSLKLITEVAAQNNGKLCTDGTRSYLSCDPQNPRNCQANQRCECDRGGGIITGSGGFPGNQPNYGGIGNNRCFCCGGARGGVILPGGGFTGGINNNFGSGGGRCPDGSNGINACSNDNDCGIGDYICVPRGPGQIGSGQGSCCPSCQRVLQNRQPNIVGGYVPRCIGRYYSADQSHSGTGESWCVTRHGVEIPNSRTRPGVPRTNTQSCEILRQQFGSSSNYFGNNNNNFGNQYRGQCPLNTGFTSGLANSQTCISDSQCPTYQKCCPTNRGLQCLNPINSGNIGGGTFIGGGSGISGSCTPRPGQCSTIAVGSTPIGGSCRPFCDSDCPAGMKCCFTRTGHRCIQSNNQGGINIIGNQNQCFSSIIKSGQCPINQGTNIFTGAQCSCDNNCGGNQKCCSGRCTQPLFGGGVGGSQFCSGNTKAGICPFSGTIIGSVGGINDQCRCDDQCVGTQKCCATGSGRQCRTPLNNVGGNNIGINCGYTRDHLQITSDLGTSFVQVFVENGGVTKPGFCPLPPINRSFLRNRNQCVSDQQCQNNFKCCQMYSGAQCVAPNATSSQQCGPNAQFDQCQKPCPATCENPNPPPCPSIKCSPGCQCNAGYIRQGGTPEAPCVRQDQCNQGGPRGTQSAQACRIQPNKEYRTCASGCPIGCNNRDDPPTSCAEDCLAGCFCIQGFIFRDARNWRNSPCVRPNQCSGPGPVGNLGGQFVGGSTVGGGLQVGIGGQPPGVSPGTARNCFGDNTKEFERCGTPCPIGCDNLNNPPTHCSGNCVSGCFCKRGLVFENSVNWRYSRCVPRESCPNHQQGGGSIIRPGGGGTARNCLNDNSKVFKDCGTACPVGCDNVNNPPQRCTSQCVQGCFCRDNNYVFENSGNWRNSRCVPRSTCSSPIGGGGNLGGNFQQCNGDIRKEYRTCGSACPRGCDNINRVQSCTRQCVQGCQCRPPYIFLNAANWQNSQCVFPSSCQGGGSGGIGVFGQTGQRPGNCPSITSSQQGPSGTVCQQDQECPEDQKCCQDLRLGINRSPTTRCICPDPNSSFNACGPACEPNCSQLNQQCPTTQCRRGCFCNSSFVRQFNSKAAQCIPQRQCANIRGGSGLFGQPGRGNVITNPRPISDHFAIAYVSERADKKPVGAITGTIRFAQEPHGVRITGTVTGLPPGRKGMIIHELGDIAGSCANVGGHFNPDNTNHGDPDDPYDNSHAGDIGNTPEPTVGKIEIDKLNRKIRIDGGRYNVIGRTFVIHERPDNFGRDRDNKLESTINGDVGRALACGVIGRANPEIVR